MADWLSYAPADFLMFSPDAYGRLFELHNRALWPGHLLVLVAAAVVVVMALRRGPAAGRAISAILAAFWLLCGWSFHLERYASIHLAAPVFAAGFAAQSLLLAWTGVIRGGLSLATGTPATTLIGWAILVFAVVGYPLVAPLAGRPWLQAEVVGLAPDPTAAATIALVLLDGRRRLWPLLLVPVAWALVSATTLSTIGRTDAPLLPAVAALALAAVLLRRPTPRATPVCGPSR